MDELLQWLKQQNCRIRAFTGYQHRAAALAVTGLANAAHLALLSTLAGQLMSSYNSKLLSADVAGRAYKRLVAHTEAARKSVADTASELLVFLNKVAAVEL